MNKKTKMKPQVGDIVFAVKYKGTYLHYGIYIGNQHVIHYRTENYNDNSWKNAKIIETSLEEFAHGSDVYIEPSKDVSTKSKTSFFSNLFNEPSSVKTAKSLLGTGEGQYNVFSNNCEHFVNYCKYGRKESVQITNLANRFPLNPLVAIIWNYVQNNYIIPKKCQKIDI